jgi:hypothetical protein
MQSCSYSITSLFQLRPQASLSRSARRAIFRLKLWRPSPYIKRCLGLSVIPCCLNHSHFLFSHSLSVAIQCSPSSCAVCVCLCATQFLSNAVQMAIYFIHVCASTLTLLKEAVQLISDVNISTLSTTPTLDSPVSSNKRPPYLAHSRQRNRQDFTLAPSSSTGQISTAQHTHGLSCALLNIRSLNNKTLQVADFIL